MSKISTKVLTSKLWDDVVDLFGTKGACGGCWCMTWRVEKGESWAELKGAKAKARFKRLVEAGEAHGILAYDGHDPVGWCAMGPRQDFSKLDRSPSLKCDDAEEVWSLPCFFVKAGYRGQGVAGVMLAAALKELKRRKVKIAEGYPVRPQKKGEAIPAAFAWTGTRALFDAQKFEVVGNKGGGKERVRRICP